MRMVYNDELQDYICYADKPVLCVREVTPRPDYTLLLTFSNDERRVYDVRPLFDYELFSPLRDLPLFMQAHCDGCTVVWNDNLDIAPETLYEKSVPVDGHISSETAAALLEARHLVHDPNTRRYSDVEEVLNELKR